VLGILLFLTEPVQYLPKAVLGAVIVSAAIGLVDPQAWRALAAVDRVEVAIAGVTTGCVVGFGVLEALVVAVGLSVIDTVRRSARPTTPCSAGSSGSGATATSPFTGRHG
jgi:sulfate permease, SulP family